MFFYGSGIFPTATVKKHRALHRSCSHTNGVIVGESDHNKRLGLGIMNVLRHMELNQSYVVSVKQYTI